MNLPSIWGWSIEVKRTVERQGNEKNKNETSLLLKNVSTLMTQIIARLHDHGLQNESKDGPKRPHNTSTATTD